MGENIFHRDFKSANVLINPETYDIMICDFGTCCVNDVSVIKPLEKVTSRFYRSPELIQTGKFSKPSDLWSIGCIFQELISNNVKQAKYQHQYGGQKGQNDDDN